MVIPNFIDTSRFTPVPDWLEERSVIERRRPGRLVHVSNFRAVKDPSTVVDIFLRVREHAATELWLIGEGPEFGAVQRRVVASGRERDVRFFGLLTDVGPTLARGDLLLMASQVESFCLAAVEAMSCGVPVLAPRVGGLPEVVEHGTTGFLYPEGRPAAAVRLALDYLSRPDRHAAVKQRSRQRAQLFDQDRVVPLYEHLYRSLVQRRLLQRVGTGQAVDGRAAITRSDNA
jgi:N-acetyl-alpha-D-glucosaminyl L-malate synthase BshA